MCHANNFRIDQEISELWIFYLVFDAPNFAGLDTEGLFFQLKLCY
jgi:hypothetical protein